MAQHNQQSNYTQGYSSYTAATHLLRTADSDAAFLLPHVKKTDHILDVGCGPCTITTSLAKYANECTMIGIDISSEVLQKVKTLAAEANITTQGPGSVVFEESNILEGLTYPDNTFDVVYCSQLFGHLKGPEKLLRALVEIRRVLKTSGILATRDRVNSHFHPQSLDLDCLSHRDENAGGVPCRWLDADGCRVSTGAGARVFSGPEARKFLAKRATGQLQQGDPFRESWLDAGITEEIQETLVAVGKWAETEDAWLVRLQCEMLAWK